MTGKSPRSLKHLRVTVAGLGHFGGGIAVARWLVEQGAKVLVTDMASADKLADSVDQLKDLPIDFRLGEHRIEDFTGCDLLVISPAIKPSNPYLVAAQQAGVPITLEIAFFTERCQAPIVGVTGTKGKSTTSSLLGRMLQTKYKTFVGGNIGGSLLTKTHEITASDVVVLELSSYMLHYLEPLRWSPHVAVVTMLAEDHLDWHGSADAYLAAKRNIVRFQSANDVAVLGPGVQADRFAAETAARVVRYGADSQPFALGVPGQHNQLNAAAAFAAAAALGVTREAAQAAVKDFGGLPHRLERVATVDGVRYYNDSIATVPAAAIAALNSFDAGKVIHIVGGSDKGLPYDEMANALAQHAKAVLCIGTTGPTIAGLVRKAGGVEVVDCGDLEKAVAEARRLATIGDVVLLSPGCASYDQFTNFEQRGNRFKQRVQGSSETSQPV